LLYSSYLPLGVPNWLVIHHAQGIFWCHQPHAISSFFGAVAGEKSGRPQQGEFFAHTSFTLFYNFALLYLFYLHRFISKTQKNLNTW
jgi:hypothetical protein